MLTPREDPALLHQVADALEGDWSLTARPPRGAGYIYRR
jgi:hypothetical protein